MEANLVHLKKALSLIVVIEEGMLMAVSASQPENKSVSMVLTEEGIVTEVRPKQPPKAPSPIEFTELGMSMEVKLLQFAKA
jgi:hypothetical protein